MVPEIELDQSMNWTILKSAKKTMAGLFGSVPSMCWEGNDFEGSGKSFQEHVNFMFQWALIEKS